MIHSEQSTSKDAPSGAMGKTFTRKRDFQIESLELSAWKRQADQWDSFSFFQTPEWVEVLCGAFSEFHGRACILQSSASPPVLFPVIENRKGPGLYTWLSLPYGTYGGPIPLRNQSLESSWSLVEAFLAEQGFSAINITLPPQVHAPQWTDYQIKTLTTQVLDLQGGFNQLLERSFTPACKRALRKAERHRLEVKPLKAEHYLDAFLALYEQSINRWELDKGFPSRLFELLWAMPAVKVWGALQQDQLVAAALIFTHKTHQYYWLGVMDEALQHLRANNLLFSQILQQSCRDGIETFDFGNSEGLIGVFNFKKSFGPSLVTYAQLYHAGALVKGYRRLKSLLKKPPEEP